MHSMWASPVPLHALDEFPWFISFLKADNCTSVICNEVLQTMNSIRFSCRKSPHVVFIIQTVFFFYKIQDSRSTDFRVFLLLVQHCKDSISLSPGLHCFCREVNSISCHFLYEMDSPQLDCEVPCYNVLPTYTTWVLWSFLNLALYIF